MPNDGKRSATQSVQQRLYFKHVYGNDIDRWGAICFPRPKSQTGEMRSYLRGGLVLLAMTKSPDFYPELVPERLPGKIFAVCTLLDSLPKPTSKLANPDMVQRYRDVSLRWPEALAILELWRFRRPKRYDGFGEGELTRVASQPHRRGRLIDLGDHPAIESDVRAWFENAEKYPDQVFRSDNARDHLRQRSLICQ